MTRTRTEYVQQYQVPKGILSKHTVVPVSYTCGILVRIYRRRKSKKVPKRARVQSCLPQPNRVYLDSQDLTRYKRAGQGRGGSLTPNRMV